MSDFNFVTSRLATGGAMKTSDDVKALQDAGVTHVIDCWGEEDHNGIFSGTSIVWMRPPPTLDDGTPKPASWFEAGLAFGLGALAKPNTRVLAHCAGGINRGPSMAYAILRAQGFLAADAFRFILINRPQALVRYQGDADKAIMELGYK